MVDANGGGFDYDDFFRLPCRKFSSIVRSPFRLRLASCVALSALLPAVSSFGALLHPPFGVSLVLQHPLAAFLGKFQSRVPALGEFRHSAGSQLVWCCAVVVIWY